MSTLNISLPPALESFVDEQVAQQGFEDGAEFVRDLIRREQGRADLRNQLSQGAASEPGRHADTAYFADLAARLRADGVTREPAVLSVSVEAYAEFVRLLDAPPRSNDALRRTMNTPPPWHSV